MKKCPFHLYDTCSPPREFRPFLARACIASRFNILHFCLVFFNFLSKLSNSVQIVQLCPNCPTLSKLSNYVQIVQLCSNCPILCPKCPILFKLSIFFKIVQFCSNCPILFKLSNFMSKLSKLSNYVQIVQLSVQNVQKVQFIQNVQNSNCSRFYIESFNLVISFLHYRYKLASFLLC